MYRSYTQPDVPGSIVTQLAMLDSTIEDAEKKQQQALDDHRSVVDTFYSDLIGKVVVFEEQRYRRVATFSVLIYHIRVDKAGNIQRMAGKLVRRDGTTGSTSKYISAFDIAEGRVKVKVDG